MNHENRERITGSTVVMSLSGGKDSTATALYIKENDIPALLVNIDTGWELWQLYHYVYPRPVAVQKISAIYPMWSQEEIARRLDTLDAEYGGDAPLERALGPIIRIRGPRTMRELYLEKAMFPAGKSRWCTSELKTKPMSAFIAALQGARARHADVPVDGWWPWFVTREDWEEPRQFWVNAYGHDVLLDARRSGGGQVVNAVGIRGEESPTRAAMPEWEYSKEMDCDVWRPIHRWTREDVILAHQRHGIRPCKLYLMGMQRVGCGPCIKEIKQGIRIIAETDPDRINLIRQDEAAVTAMQRARREAQGKEDLGPAAWFQAKQGRAGTCWPIDKAIAWSKTDFRTNQYLASEIFAADMREDGCMRWGLCETRTGGAP